MKQTTKKKGQVKDASREIHTMLKRAINTKVPIIIDTPPHAMTPKLVHLTEAELDQYNFEILNSVDRNISPVAQAKSNIRFNKAVNAFRQAGIAANTYSHIGYYQIPQNEEDNSAKQYRYILLW